MIRKSIYLLVLIFTLVSKVYSAEKMKVAVSIFPLTELVKSIGGDFVEVTTVLPVGASPHTFEPKPKDMVRFSNAKVVFMVGGGLDFWVEKIFTGREKDIIRLYNLIKLPDVHVEHQHGRGSKHKDPHFWLDPIIMIDAAKIVYETLSSLMPQNKDYFGNNFNRIKADLTDIDNLYKSRLQNYRGSKIITFHNAWGYLAKRYGLMVEEVLIESTGKEPSPKKIKRIMDKVRAMNIKAIFVEPQFNVKSVKVIAKDMNIKLIVIDPIGGFHDRDSYRKLMHYNLEQLLTGLQ